MSTQASALPPIAILPTSNANAPARQLPELEPEPEAPALVTPPLPAKTLLQRFGETPHGEAAKLWCNCAGALLGYVAPVVTLTAAGVAVSNMPGARALGAVPVVAGLIGGIAQAGFQAEGIGSNVQLYTQQGHPYPRWASFRDVMAFFVAPGVAAELGAGYLFGPEAGLVSGIIAALLVGSYAVTTNVVRRKHIADRPNG